MVLICNHPAGVDELFSGYGHAMSPVSLARLARMHGRARAGNIVKLREDAHYAKALHAIAGIGMRDGELPLGS
jgi:beta-N-acetylhexosaminidase